MKFLVTGSLHNKKGPRIIITVVSLYILIFLIIKTAAGFSVWSSVENARSFYENTGEGGMLDEIHSEIFYFAIMFLFTGSVIRELFSAKYRIVSLYLLFASGLLYLFLFFLSYYIYEIIPLAMITFYAAFMYHIFLQIWILIKLNIAK